MAELAGYGGSITFTNYQTSAKAWTSDLSVDMLDTTDFADGGYRTFIAGLKGGTATVEYNWDVANTAALGASATLTLLTTTGLGVNGAALLTSISIGVPVDGLATVTATFTFTGTITIDTTP